VTPAGAVVAFSREGSVPSWAILLILAIPAVLMGFLLIRAIGLRARQERVRASPLARRAEGIPLGSAGQIADGGQVPWENLLEALAVAPEDHGPAGGLPHDEGWMGTMLGLKARMSSGTGPSEPHVYWGERAGRQVLIRIGADEQMEGGQLTTNRRLIEVTLVRAQFPPFELRGDDGALDAAPGSGPLPGAAAAVIVLLEAAPDVWRRLRIVAGPEGIVARRPAFDDFVSGWIYDLWLLERLADATGAPALERRRIGPAFEIPYGMGRAS
jgi:hypothetical protein